MGRLFGSLAAEWTFERAIEGYGSMSGSAVFTPVGPAELLYREDGLLTLDSGQALPAYREFEYRLEDGAILVAFHQEPISKGLMFRLEPTFAGAEAWPAWAEAEHPCREDLYRGRYEFESRSRFRTVIRIDGPRKAAMIETAFRRIVG